MIKLLVVFFLFMFGVLGTYFAVRDNKEFAGKVLLYGIPAAVLATALLGFIVVVF